MAFVSVADNLSTEDNNSYNNIFVRDLQENTTTLVSRASGGAGTGANDSSYDPAISADGRHVTYYSYADNLSTEDNNTYANIFVRDLSTNTTTLVSRATGAAGTGADESSFLPRDIGGRPVHRVPVEREQPQRRGQRRLLQHLRPRRSGQHDHLRQPRRPAQRGPPGTDSSFTPSISDSGRYVSFTSDADNLSTRRRQHVSQHLRARPHGRNHHAREPSNGAGGAGPNDSSDDSSISADGRRVAFDSSADNLSAEDNNAYYERLRPGPHREHAHAGEPRHRGGGHRGRR